MKKSEQFIRSVFENIDVFALREDEFLAWFYQQYEQKKQTEPTLTMYQYYMDYVFQNEKYDDVERQIHTECVCDMLYDQIFKSPSKMREGIPRSNRAPVPSESPASDSASHDTSIASLDYATIYKTIGDFIKSASVAQPDDSTVQTQHDDVYHETTRQQIIDAVVAKNGALPRAVHDADFAEKNKMIDLWHDTENRCMELDKHAKIGPLLEKVYFLDASTIVLARNASCTTLSGASNVDDLYIKGLPVETLTTQWEPSVHSARVTVVNRAPVATTVELVSREVRCAYICGGSAMIPGGGVENGMHGNEAELCYCSTYSNAITQLDDFYPLRKDQVVFSPHVLVFRDTQIDGYPSLTDDRCESIAVITSSSPFRPRTNLVNQNNYAMDFRLWDESTRYANPDNVLEQYRSVFKTALFFRRYTVVLDDRGITEFWLPPVHTAQLLAQVVKEFADQFDEIIVSVKNPDVYKIFEKYIMG